jgi:hypothetical protein
MYNMGKRLRGAHSYQVWVFRRTELAHTNSSHFFPFPRPRMMRVPAGTQTHRQRLRCDFIQSQRA